MENPKEHYYNIIRIHDTVYSLPGNILDTKSFKFKFYTKQKNIILTRAQQIYNHQ